MDSFKFRQIVPIPHCGTYGLLEDGTFVRLYEADDDIWIVSPVNVQRESVESGVVVDPQT